MDSRRFSCSAIGTKTLENLKAIFKAGTQVEVVKVCGLDEGLKGVVKEVKANGNITVIWSTGYETDVIFGMESVRAIAVGPCILERKPKKGGCNGDKCKDCGWNTEVAKQRIEEIRAGKMVMGKDGVYRLKVSKEVTD